MSRHPTTSVVRYLMAVLLCACMLPAMSASDAAPPPHIQQALGTAYLSGGASFRWFGMKIYDAQLWVDQNGYDTANPQIGRYALDLRYARSLQGKKIAEASRDEMEKLGVGTARQHADWLAQMERLFPDVRNGTHLTGIHLPGEGVRFFLNGAPLGEIRDNDFATAFFAIWLAPKTSAPTLRRALLEQATARQ